MLDITSTNAKGFRFPPEPNLNLDGFPAHVAVDERGIGVHEMGEALIDTGADRALVTPAWLENHFR